MEAPCCPCAVDVDTILTWYVVVSSMRITSPDVTDVSFAAEPKVLSADVDVGVDVNGVVVLATAADVCLGFGTWVGWGSGSDLAGEALGSRVLSSILSCVARM